MNAMKSINIKIGGKKILFVTAMKIKVGWKKDSFMNSDETAAQKDASRSMLVASGMIPRRSSIANEEHQGFASVESSL